MKKVGVITIFHGNYNFGASLQAFALQQVLLELGCDAELIDVIFSSSKGHQGQEVELLSIVKSAILKRVSDSSIVLRLYRKARRYLALVKNPLNIRFLGKERQLANRAIKFDRFKKEYIRTTKPILADEIDSIGTAFDIYITGSDQVWNPTYYEAAYFLDFVHTGKIKASYAASIARSVLDDIEKEKFKKWLIDFDYISVRENEGKNLLDQFLEHDIFVDLDPTLLLNKERWKKLEDVIATPDSYLLCIFLSSSQVFRQIAEKIGKKLNRKIVFLTTSREGYITNDKFRHTEFIDVSPRQYLTLIRKADFVLTDSFHALAFSVNYHKQFFVVRRDSDSSDASMNSRIYTLLDKLSLNNRIIDESNVESVCLDESLHLKTDIILNELREQSLNRLKLILSK